MQNLSYVGTTKGLMDYINNEVADFEHERMESIRSDYNELAE